MPCINRRLVLLLVIFCGPNTQAQEPTATATPRNFQILHQQTVNLGDRSISYNFVETPPLVPLPNPPPSPPSHFEEFESDSNWSSKPEVFLFLLATVYDHEVTEIRWGREEGEYVIWSSVDFNLLRNILDFEAPLVRYSLLLSVGNETRAEVEAWNAYVDANALAPNLKRQIPTIQALGPGRSSHRIVTPATVETSLEAVRALEEIHRYFDANQARLVREYEESEAVRIAHQEWLRLNPPVLDTTINFFPIRSVYREDQTP